MLSLLCLLCKPPKLKAVRAASLPYLSDTNCNVNKENVDTSKIALKIHMGSSMCAYIQAHQIVYITLRQ
jgi:hypothetical protein